MTRLVIAEKPSVGRDLAKVLGAGRPRDGFLEGNGWIVTWCIGHLVELIEPHEYDPEWKRWSLATLPMLPAEFRLRPVQSTTSQFQVVKRLLHSPGIDEVVNACDAGREGELIFRYVYQLAGARVPIKRLWISSMTDQAIEEGMADLRPAADYQRLFEAARSRSEADWLVGLNATRAITVKARQAMPYDPDRKGPLYSVGRVQTPTLALIVDREHEIVHFKPKDYWQLEATFESPKGIYRGRWFRPARAGEAADGGAPAGAGTSTAAGGEKGAKQDGIVDRFDLEADARAVRDKVLGKTGKVLEVEQKRTREAAPLLFDLTRLQRTANKRYSFSAAHTLEVAQALYERHKLLTYPRTDSTHLSSDMVPRLKSHIAALRVPPYAPFADRLLQLEKLPISKRFVDDKKVSDHHAIIPTPTRPALEKLSADEKKIYDLVARRFLGIFFPDAVFDKTKVITGVEGETFVTRGKVMVDPGWREVAGFKDDEPKKKEKEKAEAEGDGEGEEEEDQGALPPLVRGDPAKALELELLKKQTQPPPRFTEASLLAAMEGAGRLIEEDELQQAMKDRGLGTPATRASIIETLINRQYIYRKGKSLLPTEKGIRLIAAVPVESLRSPQLTGEWEARLARMSRGDYPSDRFMEEVRGYVRELIDRIRRARPIEAVAEELLPTSETKEEAGKGGAEGAAKGKRAAGAKGDGAGGRSRGEGRTAKQGDGAKSGKRKEKEGSRPDDPEGTLGRCPRCQGPVLERAEMFACVARGRGCGFALRAQVAGKKLSPSMVTKLLEKGRTQVLKGFVSPKSGVKFDAALILKPDGGIGFEFQNEPGESERARHSRSRPAPSPEPAPRATASAGSAERAGDDGWDLAKEQAFIRGMASPGGESARAVAAPIARTTARPAPPPASAPAAPAAPAAAAPAPAAGPASSLGRCPLCRQGQVIAGRRAWGCSRWKEGCRLVLPFEVGGRPLSEAQAKQLLTGAAIGPLEGLEGPDGAPIEARVRLVLEPASNHSQLRIIPAG